VLQDLAVLQVPQVLLAQLVQLVQQVFQDLAVLQVPQVLLAQQAQLEPVVPPVILVLAE